MILVFQVKVNHWHTWKQDLMKREIIEWKWDDELSWGVKFALKGVEKRISARWRSSFSGMSSNWQGKTLCPFAEILQNSYPSSVSSSFVKKMTLFHILSSLPCTTCWRFGNIRMAYFPAIFQTCHGKMSTQGGKHYVVAVVQWLSRVWLCNGLQHARLNCPSPFPGACSNSCPLGRWCHPTSVSPFFSCLQSFPASGSFPTSRLFASGGQKYRSFSISPSNEYSELISFRID